MRGGGQLRTDFEGDLAGRQIVEQVPALEEELT